MFQEKASPTVATFIVRVNGYFSRSKTNIIKRTMEYLFLKHVTNSQDK